MFSLVRSVLFGGKSGDGVLFWLRVPCLVAVFVYAHTHTHTHTHTQWASLAATHYAVDFRFSGRWTPLGHVYTTLIPGGRYRLQSCAASRLESRCRAFSASAGLSGPGCDIMIGPLISRTIRTPGADLLLCTTRLCLRMRTHAMGSMFQPKS